jgi:hypothetical protein
LPQLKKVNVGSIATRTMRLPSIKKQGARPCAFQRVTMASMLQPVCHAAIFYKPVLRNAAVQETGEHAGGRSERTAAALRPPGQYQSPPLRTYASRDRELPNAAHHSPT